MWGFLRVQRRVLRVSLPFWSFRRFVAFRSGHSAVPVIPLFCSRCSGRSAVPVIPLFRSVPQDPVRSIAAMTVCLNLSGLCYMVPAALSSSLR